MNKLKKYNTFVALSSLTRNLIDIFSCILLYKMGYNINHIIIFLITLSLTGILTDYITLKTNYKINLIISSILYGICYYYLSIMNNTTNNLITFGILLSISNYSYTIIKHLLAIKYINNLKKDTSKIIIITYIANILSSLIGSFLISKFTLELTSILIIILSTLSLIPIIKLNIKNNNKKIKLVNIKRKKILFNITSQFKIIFLTLEPLYLYLYINTNIYYIGIFNVIMNISSLIITYFISEKIKNKYIKIMNYLFCITLLLKLNIKNIIFITLIAFFEGIFQKIYEISCLENLYDSNNNDIYSYLMTEELIFCLSRIIILIIILILNINLITILYICIIGIFISNFFINTNN